MSWIRVDDQLADHPKILCLGDLAPLAIALQIRALCWSSRYLTDGKIPLAAIPPLLRGFASLCSDELRAKFTGSSGEVREKFATGESSNEFDWPAAMVRAGLWEPLLDGCYMIHDYLEYNPSRAQVLAGREAARERMQKQRGGSNGSSGNVRANFRGSSQEVQEAPAPAPTPKEKSKTSSAPKGAAQNGATRMTKDTPAVQKPSWLTPFVNLWVRTYGGQPACGELAKHLRPLVDSHAFGEVLDHWARYLVATAPEYVSPARFAQTYGKWGKPERARAGVPDMYLTLEEQAARRAKAGVRPSASDPTLPTPEDT